MKVLIYACALVTSTLVASGQKMPELRNELVRMRERDQAARVACADGTADEQAKCLVKIFEEIDRPNTKRLNEIFAKYGFPAESNVGHDGVEAFILLMQHSGDVELRKKSEAGMKKAFDAKMISPSQYSGFVDRLLVDQGKPQIYGSNFETKEGKLVMSPVEDPKKLDERRKSLGLPPIAEYAKILKEFYKLEVIVPPAN